MKLPARLSSLQLLQHPLQLRHFHQLLLDSLALDIVPLVELVLHAAHDL
jgi:hypothetical protein